ncbi:20811_t:CDS:2, partial [Racocetra persica]
IYEIVESDNNIAVNCNDNLSVECDNFYIDDNYKEFQINVYESIVESDNNATVNCNNNISVERDNFYIDDNYKEFQTNMSENVVESDDNVAVNCNNNLLVECDKNLTEELVDNQNFYTESVQENAKTQDAIYNEDMNYIHLARFFIYCKQVEVDIDRVVCRQIFEYSFFGEAVSNQ